MDLRGPPHHGLPPTSSLLTLLTTFRPTPASIPNPSLPLRLGLPLGLPAHITPLSPVHFVPRAASIWPDKIAVANPDGPCPSVFTYAVFAQRVMNFGYALRKRGLGKGDRVCVISPNSIALLEAHSGVLSASATLITPNVRLPPPDLLYILQHSRPSLLLIDQEFAHLLPLILPERSGIEVIICQDSGREGCAYEQFLTEGRGWSGERGWGGLEGVGDEDQAACINYTSGTTGRPKGVVTTHRSSYLAALTNAYHTKLDDSSIYLWTLPMFHAAGWTYPWAVTLAGGCNLILRMVRYDLIWKHLIEDGVTAFCSAPTVTLGILNSRPSHLTRLPRPVLNIGGGAAPTAVMIQRCEEVGLVYAPGYGMTETLGIIIKPFVGAYLGGMSAKDRAALLARQGHAQVSTEDARVVFPSENLDDPLVDVPFDGKTVGELIFRGNNVMKGYLDDPEATAKAFKGGWMHSGDLAVRFPTGEVFIQDRSKDIIISGGENIASIAVEGVLATHPAVKEVAVVARPDEKWGERPMAFVIANTEHLEYGHEHLEKHIKAHARKGLAGFAVPEWVHFVEELPKTITGKVQKNLLRMRAKEMGTEQVKAKL